MDDTAGVRFPPPLIFLGSVMAGALAGRVAGEPRLSGGTTRALGGGALAALGAVPMVAALADFRAAGTRPEPWEASTTFVADGPYRWTRNPMYLGMASIGAGLGVALGSSAAVAGALVGAALVDRTVIPREERYLGSRFGETYDRYRARVRRWL